MTTKIKTIFWALGSALMGILIAIIAGINFKLREPFSRQIEILCNDRTEISDLASCGTVYSAIAGNNGVMIASIALIVNIFTLLALAATYKISLDNADSARISAKAARDSVDEAKKAFDALKADIVIDNPVFEKFTSISNGSYIQGYYLDYEITNIGSRNAVSVQANMVTAMWRNGVVSNETNTIHTRNIILSPGQSERVIQRTFSLETVQSFISPQHQLMIEVNVKYTDGPTETVIVKRLNQAAVLSDDGSGTINAFYTIPHRVTNPSA